MKCVCDPMVSDPASNLKAIKTRRSRARASRAACVESLIAEGRRKGSRRRRRRRRRRSRSLCLHLSREKTSSEKEPKPILLPRPVVPLSAASNEKSSERREWGGPERPIRCELHSSLLPDDFEIRYLIGLEV